MSERWSTASRSRERKKPLDWLGAPNFCSAKIWWSRSGSNRRPLECHSISGCDYSLLRTGNPKTLRTFGFSHWVHVSVWLRVFTDKRRTVTNFVRLIRTQEVHLNLSNLRLFFFSVRELSVSSKRGDGNGKTSEVSMVRP